MARAGRGLLVTAAFAILALPAHADILIGVAGPLSGQYALFGNQMRTGTEAAVSAINAAGGINGENLQAVVADDACDTKRAADAARQFVTQDVRLVVGHFCSGASAAAALIYRDAGVLMISPSASQPALTEAGHWNVFRLAGRDDAPFRLAAERINSLAQPENAAIANFEDQALGAFAEAAAAILPNAARVRISPDSFDPPSTASELLNGGAKHVILALPSSEAAKLITALEEQGFQGTVYGNEALLTDAFIGRAPETAFNILAAFPADPMTNPVAAPTVEALATNGKVAEGSTLPSYAAVQAFVAAAKIGSVNDTRAIADWLRGGNTVATVLGPVTFEAKGDLARQPFTWYRWLGSAKRFVPE